MSQAIQTALETRSVEYVAFQSQEKIKLSVAIIKQFIAVPFYNKETREHEYPSDAQCVKFMLLNRARQLNPFEADSFMIPFWDSKSNSPQWSLITAHNAFLKRAEVHPQYEGMDSGVIVEVDGNIRELDGDFVPDSIDGEKVRLVGGWAKVYRKDRKTPMYKRAKLSTWQKDFGHWRVDPAGQIVKIAEADALRSSFPNTLGGMYLQPEPGTVEVQAAAETVAERRPDFGQQNRKELPPTPRARKLQETTPEKPPQKPVEQPGETQGTIPQSDASDAASQGEQSGAPQNEPDPEGLNHSGRQGDMPETMRQTGTRMEPEPEDDPTTQATETLPELPPFVPNPKESLALQSVRLMMHKTRIPESAVMAWAKANKLAKDTQTKLTELADSKIENMNANWHTIQPKILALMPKG